MAFTDLTIGGRTFVKTLNPQIHFISGNLPSSVFETVVPHLKQEYRISNFSLGMFSSGVGASASAFSSVISLSKISII